jgi:circadian clock protein KaiC
MNMSEVPTVPRLSSGVAGLDEMLNGGYPAGHMVLVVGPPGVGKTCLSLQFLMDGLARGEKGLYLSLEEDVAALQATATQFRWPLEEGMKKGLVKVVKLDAHDANRALTRIQGELPRELLAMAPRRMVVDSVSLLNMLAADKVSRRNVLFALTHACRAAGATTLLTAEADPRNPGTSRDGLSEYVADGVLVLGPTEDTASHSAGLQIRVLKMRRTAHVRTRQPYAIGASGITVDAHAKDFSHF